jgi:RNA polymerase sigma-70 factor (ECF subfamily)
MELYRKYKDYLYNACLRLLKNKEDAEDAVHEAFIKGFRRLGQGSEVTHIGGWLKRIAVNHCIDLLRKRKGFYLEAVEDHEIAEPEVSFTQIPMAFIKSSLEKLDAKYRMVLVLYLIEDYSHKEISEQLKLKESTVRNQYIRGKKKLLHLIKTYYNDETENLYSTTS